MRASCAAVLLLAALVAAAPVVEERVVPAPAYSCAYEVSESASADASVTFTIAVQQRNMDVLKARVLDVSDPDSPRYGQWMSAQEVAELTRPADEDVAAVTAWLDAHDISYTVAAENVRVSTTAAAAAGLLATAFRTVTHKLTGKTVVRAGEYRLPAQVATATAAIFGLHGVPVPRPQVVRGPAADGSEPASVTPAVLAKTYDISGVTVNRGGKNIQAVAEFQDQFMSKEDLSAFFKAEVPSAKPGDDQISKFVGVPYTEGGSPEADLDTQFIMGVSPGVATQFWEFPNNDFCGDLHNYTSMLLAASSPPFVNSISYGWQGDVSQIGCEDPDLHAVDGNFAKLAAQGISIMISSGDSGSGYTPPQCDPVNPGKSGVAITAGDVLQKLDGPVAQCCQAAQETGAKGWTWTAPALQTELHMSAGNDDSLRFANALYSCRFSQSSVFPERDTYVLNGKLSPSGGIVGLHNQNGTFKDANITFSAVQKISSEESVRNVSVSLRVTGKHEHFTGRAIFLQGQDDAVEIEWENAMTKSPVAMWNLGPNPPPPPPQGTCKLYSSVKSTGKAPSSTQSGGPAVQPGPTEPKLYASWPAGSPWVTAVGATRFINQTPGQGEMASDQFGSGGGFSVRFNESDAAWQKEAVAAYVKQGPSLPKFPPAGTFSPVGRATPDVSGLGEGYQVYIQGRVEPVGGTSASSPMFAGLVSLMNEARFAKGQAAMGFLNPFLYKNADCFYDVTMGTNAIDRGGSPVPYGFAAATGWDPATGLGTPHFDKLLAAAMAAAERK